MRGQYDRDCHRLDHSIWIAIWGQESVCTSTERTAGRSRTIGAQGVDGHRVARHVHGDWSRTWVVSHVGGLRADETAIYLNER